MNDKDFRVGNYIYCKESEDSDFEVSLFNVADFSLLKEKILPYKPIPLTEEWLVKFGFEKEGNHFFIIENQILKFTMYPEGLICDVYGYFQEKIKHVNQLQNLFYCMTGVELEIK